MQTRSNIAETRAVLHESIENIDDEETLLILKDLAARKYAPQVEPILDNEQILQVEEAKVQIRRGDKFTDIEADALVDKWLKA